MNEVDPAEGSPLVVGARTPGTCVLAPFAICGQELREKTWLIIDTGVTTVL
jgi:hypothetical protein